MAETDYHNLQFWNRGQGESEKDWKERILHEGLLRDEDKEDGGTKTLNRFLADPNPQTREVALEAWVTAADLALADTVQLILSHLSDPAPRLRRLALRCCRNGVIADAGPALLNLLSEDSHLRRDVTSPASPENETLASELIETVEALDVKGADEVLKELGVSSEYLGRRSHITAPPGRFPAPMIGEFVKSPTGDTEILPAQDLDQNPPCPECKRQTRIVVSTRRPLGPDAPEGMNGIPFFRCLSCYAHSPYFVRVTSPSACLEEVAVDEGGEVEGPEPGHLPWRVRWKPRDPEDKEDHSYDLRLGGNPDWVQTDETPTCPLCKRRMTYVFQIPGHEERFPFIQEGGVLYGFWCATCAVSATDQQVS